MSAANDDQPSQDPITGPKKGRDITVVPQAVFARNIRPPVMDTTEKDADEQERLKILATDVIRAFQREEIKDDKAITEVVCLAPVLEKGDFQYLLRELCKGIDQSTLLDVHRLDGLAQLIQCADPGYLYADDLVKLLELLSTRLRTTHTQSAQHMRQLTMAVSRVLDAMADTKVKAYAHQALIYVPDDETLWQATLRRTGKVIQGVAGLVSAVKGLDLNGFLDGLKDIQQGVSGAAEVFRMAKSTIGGAISVADGGKSFVECTKEGLGVKRKLAWYPALRGAASLLRRGQLANFKRVVCEASCWLYPMFQWGVCQLLGEVAADSMWNAKTRQSSVMFLGEMYSNKTA
ncbi:MAG: hypothetical protein J3Q66DRAFT_421683 [Benniella sp.]|nr:MAG: hypothetical protein J3Q66DRAFT_421683 [Benniella sp.]